jgi:hypothetical protein
VTPEHVAAAQPPPGYDKPIDLVPDPLSPGVWYLAASPDDVSLFHFDESTGGLTSYSLGDPRTNAALDFGDEASIAVGSSGAVWVGAQQTLFHVQTDSGAVTSVDVPPPTDNEYAEEHRPPAIRGFHGIVGIAVSPVTGDVAIAMEAARSIVIYDPVTQMFSQLALPNWDDPASIAYTSDGVLAVCAISSGVFGTIDLFSPSEATVQRSSMDAMFVSGDGNYILVTGSNAITTLLPGAAGTAPTETQLYDAPAPPDPAAIDFEVAAAAGGSGVAVSATLTGLVVLDRGTEDALTLPTVSAAGPDMSGHMVQAGVPTTTTAAGNQTVQMQARSVAVDSLGNVWFTDNVGAGIEEITAGQY